MRAQDLAGRLGLLEAGRMVVGFDGFVDTLVRPILSGNRPFDTIGALGEAIAGQAGKSCSIELEVISRRMGGNAPLLSMAAAGLGASVTTVGMLGGVPESDFAPLYERCRCFSYADAGSATALELRDGKVFLMPRVPDYPDPFEMLCNVFPGLEEELRSCTAGALLNWSELPFAQRLWEQLYEKVFFPADTDKGRQLLFDLCDCSRKCPEELTGVLRLIGRFSKKRYTVLSCNENEYAALGEDGDRLRQRYGMDEVLVHTRQESILFWEGEKVSVPTLFVERPVLSTGTGDHFNAAYMAAGMMQLSPKERLEFANRFVHFYLTHGYGARFEELLESEYA